MFEAHIQKIKHAVPKGDKKRQKEAKQEIAHLETELDKKHKSELQVATTLLAGVMLKSIF